MLTFFFVIAVVAAILGMQRVAGFSREVGYVLVSAVVIFVMIAAFSAGPPVSAP